MHICIASLRQSIKGYTLEFYFTVFNIGIAISWLHYLFMTLPSKYIHEVLKMFQRTALRNIDLKKK